MIPRKTLWRSGRLHNILHARYQFPEVDTCMPYNVCFSSTADGRFGSLAGTRSRSAPSQDSTEFYALMPVARLLGCL